MFKSIQVISVAVIITAFAVLLAIGEAQARIINVPDDFETIQAGIDEAENGDTVLVQPGEYVENIDFDGKDITVASLFIIDGNENHIEETIIDGDENGSVVTFENGETEEALLIGLTITNGDGAPSDAGGIFIGIASPTIRRCIIRNNVGSIQGSAGIFLGSSSSNIIDCDFFGNRNTEESGTSAILCNASDITITNYSFLDNFGNRCVKAQHGGSLVVTACKFIDNSGPQVGWPIQIDYNIDLAIHGCLIAGNQSGIAAHGNIRLISNSTIAYNEGLAIDDSQVPQNSQIVNSIIWGNAEGLRENYDYDISYSDIQGGFEGESNIDEDPLFVDPNNGDYHLNEDSPCIDAGDPESPEDPDGTRADMGAFYFHQEEQDEREIREVGYYDTPGQAHDVAVSGNYALVADDNAGLRIIDISNPAQPREFGYYNMPDCAYGVAAFGSYALVADYHSGLRIIDISNPAQPRETGYYDTPDNALAVVVYNNYALVADEHSGLRIIDISNPAQPRETGYYDTPGYAMGVAVYDHYTLVSDYNSGLRIIDISNPAQPREAGYYDTPGYAMGVAVYGNYALVADAESGLCIIDISNPAQPRETGFYDTPDCPFGVAVYRHYALVADRRSGLRLIDISNPAQPREVGFYDTPGYAVDVAVYGNYALVADETSGIRILDISDFITQIIAVDTELLDFGCVDVNTREERTLIIRNSGVADLVVFDVIVEGDYFSSDFEGEFVLEPDESAEVTVTFAPEEAGDIAGTLTIYSNDPDDPEVIVRLSGNCVELFTIPLHAGWQMVSSLVAPRNPDMEDVFDYIVRNGIEPFVKDHLGRFYFPPIGFNNMEPWDVHYGYLVRMNAPDTLVIAGQPVPVDTPIPLVNTWSIVAYFPEQRIPAPDAFANIEDELDIAKDDVGNFYVPRIGFCNMRPLRRGEGYQVKVTEEVELVWNIPGQVAGLEIESSPIPSINPTITGRNMSLLIADCGMRVEELTEVGAFAKDGLCVGSVVLSDEGPWGLAIWGDDPTTEEKDGLAEGEAFTLKLSDNTPFKMLKILLGNGLVYSTDNFTVVELEPEFHLPSEYFLSDAFPNPFNNVTRLSYGLPESGRVRIGVYDVTGRLVTTLIDCEQIAGRYSVSWDASAVSSGIYLVIMEAGGFKAMRKVMLLK